MALSEKADLVRAAVSGPVEGCLGSEEAIEPSPKSKLSPSSGERKCELHASPGSARCPAGTPVAGAGCVVGILAAAPARGGLARLALDEPNRSGGPDVRPSQAVRADPVRPH